MKRRAEQAGLNPRWLAGNGLRAGFATSALLAGLGSLAVAEVTGHKSLDVLRHYIRAPERIQLRTISRLMGGQAQPRQCATVTLH